MLQVADQIRLRHRFRVLRVEVFRDGAKKNSLHQRAADKGS